jgi:hypothetical protein
MIELHQLHIPGYTPRREYEATQLRNTAESDLIAAELLPDGTYSQTTIHFLHNLIDDLCEMLQDEACVDPVTHEEEIHRIVDSYYPWSYEEAIALVADLRCYEDDLEFRDFNSWSDLFQAALVPRILNCVQLLVDTYCERLEKNLTRLNEDCESPTRKSLRERIAAELNDALSQRALMNADEVAAFILSETSDTQADVVLALLKDGRNLHEAIKAAQAI